MSQENKGIPLWGKLALYGGIAVTGLVVVYYVVKTFFTGAGDAFMEQFKLMYEEYVKKMKQYADETSGAFSQGQIESRDGEERLMGDVLGKAQAAYQNPQSISFYLGTIIIAVMGGLAFFIATPYVISKYRTLTQNNPPKTAKGATAIYDCALIDAFAASGQVVLATNMLTTLQTHWYSVEVPTMQSVINNYQSQINQGLLTGYQLAFAQYMIQSYQFEMIAMPTYFAGIVI